MSDKVNMSLDEIIRANKARSANNSGPRNPAAKKQGARLSGGRARVRPNLAAKKAVNRALVNQRNVARRGAGNNSNNSMIPRSEVKNIVNKAVKQAIKQSNANIGIAGRLGGGKIPRNIITSSKLAQLSQRSRTIQRTRMAPVVRRRGGGFAGSRPVQIVEEIVSPQPVRIIRQPVQAPVVQVVERVVQGRQPVRRIGGRNVVARQQQIARVGGGGRVIRQPQMQRVVQRPVQQRVIQVQRPAQQRVIQVQRPAQQRVIRQPQQVVYERPAPQRVQVVRRQAPVQQRVQVIRQAAPAQRRNRQQNVQYVEYAPGPSNAARKNNRFREALGLSSPRHVVRETQRFEPSSSFLANRTVSHVKRGRGFGGRDVY